VTFHWLLTGAAILLSVAALARARRLSGRLERLTESYWELRYEYGQLRARVARLDPASAADAADPEPAAPGTSFVPLSALKK